MHAHTRNSQKDFICSFRQHKWTMGNILHFVNCLNHSDLNSHFKLLIPYTHPNIWCTTKIFRGEGVVDGEGGSSE